MKPVLKTIAIIGLLLTACAPTLTFLGTIDVALDKTLLVIGMILWFATAPFLIKGGT